MHRRVTRVLRRQGAVIGRRVLVRGGEVRHRFGVEVRIDLRLHLPQRVAGGFVDAGLAHQAGAAQALRLVDHVGVDAVTEGSAVLSRVVRYVLVLLLVYVLDIVQAEVVVGRRAAVGLVLVGFQVGNALDR